MTLILFAASFVVTSEGVTKEEFASLKRGLAGKATHDRKTGAIQIAYDFRTPKHGNDFLVKQKPAAVKRSLVLDSSVTATHLVKWKSVKVEARIEIAKLNGVLMRATEADVQLRVAGQNFDGFYLELSKDPKDTKVAIVPAKERHGLIPVTFELNSDRCMGTYSSVKLSEAKSVVLAGQIEFLGGNEGIVLRSVTFTGIPDPSWVKEFINKEQ